MDEEMIESVSDIASEVIVVEDVEDRVSSTEVEALEGSNVSELSLRAPLAESTIAEDACDNADDTVCFTAYDPLRKALATEAPTMPAVALPSSSIIAAFSSTLPLPPMPGKNRVHQNAILIPRSKILCLRMNKTTRKKNTKAARTSILSSQSARSSAVMSCFEVFVATERMSC